MSTWILAYKSGPQRGRGHFSPTLRIGLMAMLLTATLAAAAALAVMATSTMRGATGADLLHFAQEQVVPVAVPTPPVPHAQATPGPEVLLARATTPDVTVVAVPVPTPPQP